MELWTNEKAHLFEVEVEHDVEQSVRLSINRPTNGSSTCLSVFHRTTNNPADWGEGKHGANKERSHVFSRRWLPGAADRDAFRASFDPKQKEEEKHNSDQRCVQRARNLIY